MRVAEKLGWKGLILIYLWEFTLRAISSKVRTVLFLAITQRVVVISYRRFGIAFRSHLQWSSTLEHGLFRIVGKEL
jgi:hypothetical protein